MQFWTKKSIGLLLFTMGSILSIRSAAGKAFAQTVPQKERAGVVISNPKTPKHPHMRLIFDNDLTIGVKEGDENYMFGSEVYINVDGRGNIFATDRDRKRIQKYGPDGKFILTIGRKGQGPGEFGNVWEPEFDKSGNLYAVDISNKRISFFSDDGRLLKEIRIPNVMVSREPLLSSRGRILAAIDRIVSEDGSRYESSYGLFDENFKPLVIFQKQIIEFKSGGGHGEDSEAADLASSMSNFAFKPDVHYTMAGGDLVYVGYTKEYEIRVYSPEGSLLRTIRKDFVAIPVTAEDKKRFEEYQKTVFLRFLPPQLEGAKAKALKLIRYPQFKPAYQDLTVGDNGWLYVTADTRGDNFTVLDIFDADGKYIAHTEAPIPAEMLRFKNGKAYAVATDEGYKFIKRYKYTIVDK